MHERPAVESAKGSLYNALIGFAIVILYKLAAGLVGSALERRERPRLPPPPSFSAEGGEHRCRVCTNFLPNCRWRTNLLLGLTARQLVRLAVGASLAYEVWDIGSALPAGVRLALTAC
jgi:hypothetical protein